jgi:hypothetical protein
MQQLEVKLLSIMQKKTATFKRLFFYFFKRIISDFKFIKILQQFVLRF